MSVIEDLQKHLPAGGYTELRWHTNHYTQLAMCQGALLENSSSRIGGVCARRHAGGAFGFASRPADSGAGLAQTVRDATRNMELLRSRVARRGAPLPSAGAGAGRFDYRSPQRAFGPAERLEVVREVDAYIARTYPGLVSRELNLSTFGIEKALVTSEGAATYSFVPRSTLLVKLYLQANDGVVEVYEIFGGFGEPQACFEAPDALFPGIDALYEELREKAGATYCQAGEFDVVLDSSIAGILAHEAIGHTCEADLVLGGSVAADHLGGAVASEKVTLIDHAERGPDGRASFAIHVDDEGTPCRDVTIIDRGVLVGYLHSKETAAKLDMTPTGNARAFEFKDEPLVRMRNTAIAPGTDRLEDMIAAVDRGYYFRRSLNGQADSTSEFMFGISGGYEIVGGQLGRAIRDTTISGVAFDVLKTVTHVGEELSWMRGGWCGKKQIIPVGMGGPAIKCRLTVGGL